MICKVYAYVTRHANRLVLAVMLLDRNAVRYVKYLSNGMDHGVPAVGVD